MRTLFCTIIITFPLLLTAQREKFTLNDKDLFAKTENSSLFGKITVSQPEGLTYIINKAAEIDNDRFFGWRVQIYFGSGQRAMNKAEQVKKDFLKAYGHKYGTYINFDSPFFKVRVGNFRTKVEARLFKEKIKEKFPNSWIIPMRIDYPESPKDEEEKEE
ncbi:MAG: hypothetical protein CSB06_03720 [Bacteroidia bacterium]|nr:MAG: hypothetical protein CSB06_03720 [Bacteroidia bacterium]